VRLLLFAATSFLAFLAALAAERLRVARDRRAVPLRIGVTGTRGKSSVVRLVAAALRGSGRRTLAKTTGSRPRLILPDGTERDFPRFGPPTILEQKRLLRTARAEGAEALVAEIMSVRPECQEVESAGILGIGVCVITNVRVDHEAEQGASRSEVARALARSVPREGRVVCSSGEDLPELRAAAARAGAELRVAPTRIPEELLPFLPALGYAEFEENLRLALETCLALGLDGAAALRSMASAIPDLGALRVWRWEEEGRVRVFVNAFAANDVASTRAVLDRSLAGKPAGARAAGLLNLREDRAERTRQWLRALEGGLPEPLEELFVLGPRSGAVRRRLAARGVPCRALRDRDPEGILRSAAGGRPGELWIVGMGNIAGPGARIVEYCAERGSPYGP